LRSSKVLASMGSWAGNGKPEVRPPGWQIAPDKRACVHQMEWFPACRQTLPWDYFRFARHSSRWQKQCFISNGSLPRSRHSGTNLSSASDLAILHSSRLNNCWTRLTQEKPLVIIHPLTRTDKAGLLGSQQQSGRYLTALLRVSHVFPSKRRPYSVDETGGVPLSMKV